ncbi:MAG: ADP-ribosylation factor-like protein [Candidatus Freyarchaeum deiterrae]
MIERLKVLVMGPVSAGKSAIIKQLVYGLVSKELRDLDPTILIKVHPDYNHGNYLCQFFECGGQESMFEEYYRPEREEILFSKVNIFLYVVDSGDAELLKLAIKEFYRTIRRVAKYSPQALPVIFAHKQDLKVHLPPEEVANILLKPNKSIFEAYFPRELAERGRVEKMLKRTLVYGTSIEEPPKSFENLQAWIRSDNAVVEVLETYKKFLREMTVLGTGAGREYSKEFLNSLKTLLTDLDGILGSKGGAVIDKSNNFIVVTTLIGSDISDTIIGNMIANSSKILEEREKSSPEATIFRINAVTMVMQSINKELAIVSVLPQYKQFEEENLRPIVKEFVNKIRTVTKSID